MGLFSNDKVDQSVDMVENNQKGKGFEDAGDIESAIALYEYNVNNRFDGSYPYNRLAIIYRKQKQYDKEIAVLKAAIDVFTHDVPRSRVDRNKKLSAFKERIKKAKELNKNQRG